MADLSSFDLTGKLALVTGASRGIGRGVALGLARAGADVAINFHQPALAEFGRDNADDATAVVSEVQAMGQRAVAIPADVADAAQVEAMVQQAAGQLGGLDILVSNAGICPFHDFLTMPPELFDRVVDVNLRGCFLVSQAAARVMVTQGRGGRIIGMSSISALVGGGSQTAYTPTKAGIHSLMQSLAIALGPHGITCNSIMPGAILTDINAADLEAAGKKEAFGQRIPVGRIGEPDDISGPVVFLASDAARYVNGAGLLVDGGMFVNLQ